MKGEAFVVLLGLALLAASAVLMPPNRDLSRTAARWPNGAGLAGSRSGLWREFSRIVDELRPRWVVVENVASGAKRWVDAVVSELGRLGYETLPVPLSAADVGAPHLRRRIFIVAADTNREQLWQQQGRRRGEGGQGATIAGRHGAEGPPPHTVRQRLQRTSRAQPFGRRGPAACPWSEHSMPRPSLCRVDDGLPAWVDRPARIKALGNSVVPQCAEVVGWVIRELEAS